MISPPLAMLQVPLPLTGKASMASPAQQTVLGDAGTGSGEPPAAAELRDLKRLRSSSAVHHLPSITSIQAQKFVAHPGLNL